MGWGGGPVPGPSSLPAGWGCGEGGGSLRRVAWRQRREAERKEVDEANKWTGAVDKCD